MMFILNRGRMDGPWWLVFREPGSNIWCIQHRMKYTQNACMVSDILWFWMTDNCKKKKPSAMESFLKDWSLFWFTHPTFCCGVQHHILFRRNTYLRYQRNHHYFNSRTPYFAVECDIIFNLISLAVTEKYYHSSVYFWSLNILTASSALSALILFSW